MPRTFFSKIKLYISAYVTIFALAAFCLLCFHERNEDTNNPNLNDNSWKEGLHTNRTLMRDSDPLSLTYAGLRWTSNIFNCSVVSDIENLELVGAGWTKAVYRGQWKDKTVAVKTLNFYGHDVGECSRKGFPLEVCYEKAAVKILREIALLTELQHKNIIKLPFYNQKDYDIKGDRVVVEWFDYTTFKDAKMEYYWYNRSQKALNASVYLLKDWTTDVVVELQMYKFMSNEYRFFPLKVGCNLCEEYAKNNFNLKNLLKNISNIHDCPVKKGFYYVYNYKPDFSLLPPFIPRGKYKAEFKVYHNKKFIVEVNAYGEIVDKPMTWI